MTEQISSDYKNSMAELAGDQSMTAILSIRSAILRDQKSFPKPGAMVYPTSAFTGYAVRNRSGFFGESDAANLVQETGQLKDIPIEDMHTFVPRNFASYSAKALSTPGKLGYSICGYMQYKSLMGRALSVAVANAHP